MLKMNRRGKDVNWSKIVNASPKPKILCLEEDDSDGLFYCPVQICNHDGFSMQRGCRKHIMNKQSWYYYFDKKPDSTQINMLSQWNQQIVKPVIKRLHRIRAGQLSLLILQTTLPRTFFCGSLAVVGAVEVIEKHNRSLEVLKVSQVLLRGQRGAHIWHGGL